jgi:hypothetical protein
MLGLQMISRASEGNNALKRVHRPLLKVILRHVQRKIEKPK